MVAFIDTVKIIFAIPDIFIAVNTLIALVSLLL